MTILFIPNSTEEAFASCKTTVDIRADKYDGRATFGPLNPKHGQGLGGIRRRITYDTANRSVGLLQFQFSIPLDGSCMKNILISSVVLAGGRHSVARLIPLGCAHWLHRKGRLSLAATVPAHPHTQKIKHTGRRNEASQADGLMSGRSTHAASRLTARGGCVVVS